MTGLLKAENFPFLLTLLIGLVGYQLNQLSDRIIKSPTIEYEFRAVKEKDTIGKVKREIECHITNISADKSFKDLIINLKFKNMSAGLVFEPQIIIEHPSSLHSELASNQEDGSYTEYKIAHFQPSCSYLLKLQTLSPKNGEKFPFLFLTSDETIVAVKASFTTWIVKNYFILNLACIGIWLFLIIIYLINYKNKSKS